MIRNILTFVILCSVYSVSSGAEDPAAINRKGAELGDKKNYTEASEQFEKSAKIYDVQSAKYYHNKGWAYELKGRYDDAFKCYSKAVERNPVQADSLERLGYHYFKNKDYIKAVELGEKAVQINPKLPYIKSWLPEAYRLKLLGAAEKNIEEEKKTLEEANPESVSNQAAEAEKKEEPKPKFFGVSLDFGLRWERDVHGGSPDYKSSPGKIVNVPFSLGMWFKPNDNFLFRMTAENPYWGAAGGSVVSQQEFLEGVLSFGGFSLGCGLWFSHYTGDEIFGADENYNDFKLGIIAGFGGADSSTEIRLYPRLVMRDTKSLSDGRSLDCGMYELTHVYTVKEGLKYYSRVSQYDFFLFDHDVPVSHYWGFTEFSLGVTLGISKFGMISGGSISFEFAKRFNLRKLNEDEPYEIFNGQGFLGYDSSGDSGHFTGYRSSSNILRISASQNINAMYYIYEKIIIEIVDRHESAHEAMIRFGGGMAL